MAHTPAHISSSEQSGRDSPISFGTVPAASGFLLLCSYGALAYCSVRFVSTPEGQRFPAVFAALGTLIFAQLFTTSARLSVAQPLCPKNWALLLFTLQLLVMPVLLMWVGPARSVLPYVPSDATINAALLINNLAYLSFLAGLASSGMLHRLRWWQASGSGQPSDSRATRLLEPSISLIGMFVLLGIVGLAFRFHSFSNLLDYFFGRSDLPQLLLNQGDARATLGDAAGTFLSGSLGFAFVLIACRLIDRLTQDATRANVAGLAALLTVAGLAAFAYAVYLYNRAAVIVPLVALAAAYSIRKRRISFPILAIASVVVAAVALQFGNWRNTYLHPESVSVDYIQQIQVYGSAPQFTAFMLAQDLSNLRLYPGQTLVSSLFYPVPALGRDFRATSGVAIYNGLIYGFSGTTDQIVPFQGELFWDFGIAGVVLGFVTLGAAIAWLQTRFEKTKSALGAYIVQYVSIWVGFLVIGSLAVMSQIAIYFMWPFLAIGFLSLSRREARNTNLDRSRV